MKLKHVVKNEALEGVIEFTPLAYDERIVLSKELVSLVSDVSKDALESQLNVAKFYKEAAFKQISGVNIKIVAECEYKDHEISTPDELLVFQEGNHEIQALGAKLINGIVLGKPKSKDSEEIAD